MQNSFFGSYAFTFFSLIAVVAAGALAFFGGELIENQTFLSIIPIEDIYRVDRYEGIWVSSQIELTEQQKPFIDFANRPEDFTGDNPVPTADYRISFTETLFAKAQFFSLDPDNLQAGTLEEYWETVQPGQAYSLKVVATDVTKNDPDFLLYVTADTSEIINYEIGF